MANFEFDQRLNKIADLIEADRREWQQRMEHHDKLLERHDEILLVHAKLVMDNEREWKQEMGEFREVMKYHESRLAANEDGLRTMLASVDRLVKTVEDFIKGLNRQNGQGQ